MLVSEATPFAEELTVLKYFPGGAAALAKIAEILAEVCKDEAEARELIDEMVSAYSEWPGPSHIRSTKASIVDRKRGEWNPHERKCAMCGGTGWVEDKDSNGNTGVRPCRCHGLRKKGAA